MPAEPTKARVKRKSSRKDLEEYRLDGGHLRELESKRNRAEVSCAECRRLKIKCDKQIPCQSCQRRGCASLCPNGSLATGQGTRFVLAATEHLHTRISRLNGRIRQLEDALASVHGKHSADTHPLLLQEELISPDDQDMDLDGLLDEAAGESAGQPREPMESFGTLSISEHGISRFFGLTGGSETLLLANLDSDHAPSAHTRTPESRESGSPTTSSEIQYFSQAFPFTPNGKNVEVQEFIESQLPQYNDILTLCDTYFEQVAWMFRGVTRGQIDDMIAVVYKRSPPIPGEDYSGPHDLALIFMMMAVAALVGQNSEALGEHYYQIARASISLQPVLERPSYVTIQALYLMSIYNAMSGSDLRSETTMEMTWSLITLASHLSQTIGLHRDSARWGLSSKMVQRRRILFWDLFVADTWQSLCTGRPPSFSLAYIDCGYPQYGKDDNGEEGSFGSAFEVWQCRFAAEIVAEVTARTLTTEAPSYATILELDQKVRNFPMPDAIASSDDFGASFQKCVLEHIRETILMYIHRSFFSQAIIESPQNPLKSSYATSFLAAYRASSTILKSVKDQYNTWANTTARFWTMWTYAFSAAVVFGTVVTRGPRSPLAKEAMGELEQACHLFAKASQYSIRAAKALPVLIRLSEKARHALQSAERCPAPADGDKEGLLWSFKPEENDELAIVSGRTRLVSSMRTPTSIGISNDPSAGSHSDNSTVIGPLPTVLEKSVPRDTTQTHTYTAMVQPPPLMTLPSPRHDHTSAAGSNPEWMESRDTARPYNVQYDYPTASGQRSQNIAQYGWPEEVTSPHRQDHHTSNAGQNTTMSYNIPLSNSRSTHDPSRIRYDSYHSTSISSQQHVPPPPPGATRQPPPYLLARPPSSSIGLVNDQYSNFNAMPQYQNHPHNSGEVGSPTMVLADLGIASRDSRLDERWGMFMANSGILEDFRR
ncbi:fungal-specific transcription factor domain-containing protein [Crepidotus variabilis]|uniref:Fungal-specific transcription factor domain-containing protein n=1 Tax=Crepidotus variabilis TaxID=179855 RepID=A0A9P6JIR2_9AGAR|nr:fungal-specific transcription factor domain-containing protein [Crepidotus variabilis]